MDSKPYEIVITMKTSLFRHFEKHIHHIHNARGRRWWSTQCQNTEAAQYLKIAPLNKMLRTTYESGH